MSVKGMCSTKESELLAELDESTLLNQLCALDPAILAGIPCFSRDHIHPGAVATEATVVPLPSPDTPGSILEHLLPPRPKGRSLPAFQASLLSTASLPPETILALIFYLRISE